MYLYHTRHVHIKRSSGGFRWIQVYYFFVFFFKYNFSAFESISACQRAQRKSVLYFNNKCVFICILVCINMYAPIHMLSQEFDLVNGFNWSGRTCALNVFEQHISITINKVFPNSTVNVWILWFAFNGLFCLQTYVQHRVQCVVLG